MSGTGSGIVSGFVIGIVAVLLAQQLGFLDLSALVPAVEYLLAGAIVGAILFGLVGRAIGRRANYRAST